MAIEAKVDALANEIQLLKKHIYSIVTSIEGKSGRKMPPPSSPPPTHQQIAGFPTPLTQRAKNAAKSHLDDSFFDELGEDDDEILDDLIDFFRPEPTERELAPHAVGATIENHSVTFSNGNGSTSPVTGVSPQPMFSAASPKPETDSFEAFFEEDALDPTPNDYELFSHLYKWLEETLAYIGKTRMARTLSLYTQYNYIPERVHQLLNEVVKLAPDDAHETYETRKIVNSLMELNAMLDGDIRIAMSELMQILGED